MPQIVVDGFEAIEIDEQQAEDMGALAVVMQRAAVVLQEGTPVRQTGEFVVPGQPQSLAFAHLALDQRQLTGCQRRQGFPQCHGRVHDQALGFFGNQLSSARRSQVATWCSASSFLMP